MTDREYVNFLSKCANIPYTDYSWLKDHCYKTLERPCAPNTRNEHLAILDLIKEHEERERQWIPCSERLPEEDGQYIITVKYKHEEGYEDIYAEHGEWNNGKWDMFYFGHCGEVEKILAWMPLPEPYKQEVEK